MASASWISYTDCESFVCVVISQHQNKGGSHGRTDVASASTRKLWTPNATKECTPEQVTIWWCFSLSLSLSLSYTHTSQTHPLHNIHTFFLLYCVASPPCANPLAVCYRSRAYTVTLTLLLANHYSLLSLTHPHTIAHNRARYQFIAKNREDLLRQAEQYPLHSCERLTQLQEAAVAAA